MQETSDEGHERSASAEADPLQGLDQDSNRVELRGGGWKGAIGYCGNVSVMRGMRTAGIEFEVIRAQTFYFAHAAAILVVQGMFIQDFFPPDVYFERNRQLFAHGPFLLLKGTLSTAEDPPPRLKNMVLAHVLSTPEGISREPLLGLLLRAV